MNSKLPRLESWNETRDALHQGMQVMRCVSLFGRDPTPNQLEYSSYPTNYGATTGPLNFGGEFKYDFNHLKFIYDKDGKEVFTVSFVGESQKSAFEKVSAEFEKIGVSDNLDTSKISEDKTFLINSKHASDFADAQYKIFRAMSVFRSRLGGNMTPIVLWPHAFDLSFIWFFNRNGFDEKKHMHMNFGFSPGIGKERPYLYFYAWPALKDLVGSKLPAKGSWITQWNTPGGAFDYDYFASLNNPENEIVSAFQKMFEKIAPMMK